MRKRGSYLAKCKSRGYLILEAPRALMSMDAWYLISASQNLSPKIGLEKTHQDPSFMSFILRTFINIFCHSLLSLEHWADLRGDGKEMERVYKVTVDIFFFWGERKRKNTENDYMFYLVALMYMCVCVYLCMNMYMQKDIFQQFKSYGVLVCLTFIHPRIPCFCLQIFPIK